MQLVINSSNIEYRFGDVCDTEMLTRALRGCDLAIHTAAAIDIIMLEA